MKEKGFTLVEVMLVLLVIAVLILITVPNVLKHSTSIDDKACRGYEKMLEGAVEAYKVDHHERPASIRVLEKEGYIDQDTSCPDGTRFTLKNGQVVAQPK